MKKKGHFAQLETFIMLGKNWIGIRIVIALQAACGICRQLTSQDYWSAYGSKEVYAVMNNGKSKIFLSVR